MNMRKKHTPLVGQRGLHSIPKWRFIQHKIGKANKRSFEAIELQSAKAKLAANGRIEQRHVPKRSEQASHAQNEPFKASRVYDIRPSV